MGEIRNFFGSCNISLKVFLGSINHNIGKTCYNSLLNLLHVCRMIQMQTEGNLWISFCDTLCCLCNQLQRTDVFDCTQGSHQNNRCILLTGTLYNTNHLWNGAEIKCSYCISFFRVNICSSKLYRVSHNLFHCK